MQDRLRFRAWNKECESYAYNIQDFGSFYPNPCWQDSFGDFLEDDDWIIEQCTGLKDKNGELIYEGDVLKLIDQCIEYEVSVYWESGMYCFAITPNSANLVFSDLSDNETIVEVIGNIHENADLTEK